MTADTLRDKFLEFFKSKKHKIISSDSLVPKDDPTVLFTPAGMNQFKKQFLAPAIDLRRAASAQRCLRTDDLDKVGKTAGHHTFFEMLGNFSFGDYFKEEAVSLAWEFLTEELNFKKERLWASVYKDDDQAYKIWKDKIGLSPDKIVKLGDKENFWPSEAKEKGPNGPCGPCSEIFFDQGNKVGCGKPDCGPSCGCGRFIEVWNLVFTQFNRKEGGMLEPLPKKNIDTGMGLERLTAVMQGASNNFETDLFAPIIKEITSVLGSRLSVIGFANTEHRTPNTELIYAIADHIRAVVFAIYDGVLPSNESRGYVIRKLIRKAGLHLRTLGLKQPFLYKLVPLVCEIMKAPYPEINKRRENIAEIILAEEKSFISTLNSSSKLFEEIGFIKTNPGQTAHKAFQLYDTYGIPYELTKEWLDSRGMEISEDIFQQDMSAQKTRSKLQSAMKGEVFAAKGLVLKVKKTQFLGYNNYQTPAKILKIIKDANQVEKISKGDEARIIIDKTVFYPESGGQVGDTGEFVKGKNLFEVLDTQKADNIIVHIGKVRQGNFKTGGSLLAKIDIQRRLSVARNHTATHLLQAALRKVLGGHVQQQGSLVAPDRLRFDFAHFKDLSSDEIGRIEETVNNYIMDNYPLGVKLMPLPQAKRSGALAFFGEKYTGRARVISIGDISKELCAGTHLKFTGQIGIFSITQESAISSGVRRIEAQTASSAYRMIKEQAGIIAEAASLLNVSKDKIVQELGKRAGRIKELEKQLNLGRLDTLKSSVDSLIENAQKINEVKIISKVIEDSDMDLLRKTVDLIKQKADNALIALGAVNKNKAFLVLGLTEDLCNKGLDASKLILDAAALIGGSGGGRKDFAQAGGNKPENFTAAFEKLKEIVGGFS